MVKGLPLLDLFLFVKKALTAIKLEGGMGGKSLKGEFTFFDIVIFFLPSPRGLIS